ncbi:MAG: sigma-70 family RNA polymerase sigma factor [Planctomycetes bacterium]|nr:sigma-70 family RNA polymerase sigma factor [Planctomycetota bacterium]
MNDDQLIDETLAGRSDAFGELVRKYQDRLYHAMRHVLGSADDALDVVQDAFVQSLVKLETFNRSAAFYTWLFRIALNLALSQRRRRRPTVSIDALREGLGREPIDDSPAPDHRMTQQQAATAVHQALAALDEDFRIVLVLRDMDDLSYEEISQVLDVPIGTVRSRLHRARLQLRELLKDCDAVKASVADGSGNSAKEPRAVSP